MKTHNSTKSKKNIRAIGGNTSVTYNSTSQRIPLSSVSTKKNQIFVQNISFKLKSCLIPRLSLCTSFLTRPPTTRSPGTRGSSLTGSWVSLEAPWGFSLASPSLVVSRSCTLPLGFLLDLSNPILRSNHYNWHLTSTNFEQYKILYSSSLNNCSVPSPLDSWKELTKVYSQHFLHSRCKFHETIRKTQQKISYLRWNMKLAQWPAKATISPI